MTDSDNTHQQSAPWFCAMLLGLLAVSSFLTGVRFVPGLLNNIGPFEVLTVLVIAAGAWFFYRQRTVPGWHSLLSLMGVLVLVATLSLIGVPAEQFFSCLIQWGMLVFAFALVWVCYALFWYEERYVVYMMRFVVYAALVASVWFVGAVVLGGGAYEISGPFRGRAHAGIIMLTVFWLGLVYAFLPTTSRRERIGIVAGLLPLLVYVMEISGRRSIYLALGAGLLLLLASTLFLSKQARTRVLWTFVPLLVIGWVSLFLWRDGTVTSYFIDRLGAVGEGLVAYTAPATGSSHSNSFLVLQREGVLHAFRENPILGIGWGAFYESSYSVTGHEIHSTPLRFLAETGIAGFVVYLAFIGRLLGGSMKLAWDSRQTSYHVPALFFAIGMVSMEVSHIYNRAMTERTFWLVVAIYMAFETLYYAKRLPGLVGEETEMSVESA